MLTVTARDAAGTTATASLTVTLSGTFKFTDDPLAAQSTVIKAVYIMEVRAAIDSVRRVARGLAMFAWTDPTLTPGSTPATAFHVTELRTALDQAYQAIHLNELRTAVRALG